jgi:hypothetical protein
MHQGLFNGKSYTGGTKPEVNRFTCTKALCYCLMSRCYKETVSSLAF